MEFGIWNLEFGIWNSSTTHSPSLLWAHAKPPRSPRWMRDSRGAARERGHPARFFPDADETSALPLPPSGSSTGITKLSYFGSAHGGVPSPLAPWRSRLSGLVKPSCWNSLFTILRRSRSVAPNLNSNSQLELLRSSALTIKNQPPTLSGCLRQNQPPHRAPSPSSPR